MVNFLTLKWGNKYGPEYVNRLHNSIKQNYNGSFNFYCITNQPENLNCSTFSFDELKLTKQKCFTAEKIIVFKNIPLKGNFVLLDLDILITKNITEYLTEYNFTEPRFIKNHWENTLACEYFSTRSWNYVNSSFVTWKTGQLDWLYDHYQEHKKLIEFKYEDLDFYLFQVLRDKLNYHPPGLVTSYQKIEDRQINEYNIILFNTSHGRGKELHEATGLARDRWLSYS